MDANKILNSDVLDIIFEGKNKVAKGATQAIGRTKLLLSQSLSRDLEAQLQAEGVSFGTCAATADMAEGVEAFLGKRPPVFNNR